MFDQRKACVRYRREAFQHQKVPLRDRRSSCVVHPREMVGSHHVIRLIFDNPRHFPRGVFGSHLSLHYKELRDAERFQQRSRFRHRRTDQESPD